MCSKPGTAQWELEDPDKHRPDGNQVRYTAGSSRPISSLSILQENYHTVVIFEYDPGVFNGDARIWIASGGSITMNSVGTLLRTCSKKLKGLRA